MRYLTHCSLGVKQLLLAHFPDTRVFLNNNNKTYCNNTISDKIGDSVLIIADDVLDGWFILERYKKTCIR